MGTLPEAISIQKSAEVLGVSPMTIHRWIAKGFLKAYRIGPRLVRIPRSEIVRMRKFRIETQDEPGHPHYPRV